MTTIVDNTIETTPPEAKANGSHANGTKVRAPRRVPAQSPFAQIATDAIIKKGLDAKAEAMARLKTLEDERGKLMEFLGLGPQAIATIETTPNGFLEAMAKPQARGVNGGRKPGVKAAPKKPRAKRATGEEAMAAQDAVIHCLLTAEAPIDVATIMDVTSLGKAVVARALKALRGAGKISVTGKNKGMRYASK